MTIDVVGKTDYSAPWRLESSTGHLETLLQDEFVVGFLDLVYQG